ncbi:hypothetical protein A4D02_32315 [Niastella koreensis]|uniref:Copper-binding protein MbnP-like domain-containing protein n=2 Tax=Niastella koreensis TaxID=354356 RepID=G8TBZ4_NIAKG|nr:MbnP family protein [Niastella koreensis]AEV99287.1 hypothetical protein Niako_2957 [Niastella koreensis GR20-10]OQP46076.1 hypothetical protein A4D02_32315 [Niastella koreensis]
MNSIIKQLLLFLGLLPVAGFVTHAPRSLTIQFKHKMGSRELQLFNESYVNPFGEPVTITRFKYYLSHFSITGTGQKETALSDKIFLIDESAPESKTLTFSISVTTPKSLSFVIGVDSSLNVSGVQTGSLDPLNGMFWTWNSGYIFARLEGKSDSSHAPAHLVNWDVGGFKTPFNASRKITLDLTPSTGPVITIEADLMKWFNAVHAIHIAQAPLCHQPGRLAMQLADNYSRMFSIAL